MTEGPGQTWPQKRGSCTPVSPGVLLKRLSGLQGTAGWALPRPWGVRLNGHPPALPAACRLLWSSGGTCVVLDTP